MQTFTVKEEQIVSQSEVFITLWFVDVNGTYWKMSGPESHRTTMMALAKHHHLWLDEKMNKQ